MWVRLFINKHGFLHPFWLRLVGNLYFPFRGAGIWIRKIDPHYHYIRVELSLTLFNRNYVGTQFGGSIYAMTDPFYMLMLIQNLGPEYIVWDKAAAVDFIKPGRSRLIAEFRFTEQEIEEVRRKAAAGDKVIFDKDVSVYGTQGELVAKVTKTLYVRKKREAQK